jgi:hypothetical protein
MVVTATTRYGRRYSYYTCAQGNRGGCGQATVATVELEAAVLREVAPSVAHPDHREAIREVIRRVSYTGSSRQVGVEMRDGSRWEFRLKESKGSGRGQAGRVPRVSRLMALAIKLEGQLGGGQLPHAAAVARLGKISRARMSQILGLRNLAPSIQEKLLFLPQVRAGGDPRRRTSHLTAVPSWFLSPGCP